VLTLTLERPDAGNRIDVSLAAELREACWSVREDDRIRVVILTGSGNTFSVGREPLPAELAAGPVEPRLAWLRQAQVASSVAQLPIPVIVAVNGDAIDHGLELALSGDLRIAAANAKLGLTDLAQGSFPWDGGTQRLLRLVGPAWAQEMILTSRVIDAAQALALGLVNRVVAADALFAEAHKLAEGIAAGGPIAARYAKEAVLKGMDLSLDQGLRLEADLNIILQSTADRVEGLQSFLQRRVARFTGQ
jgi:enoyl-CoA hydratase/carnithine racemase